ncbi:MAG: nuclear transport factor 2 family protein, partial [Microbacteriaceae bacterium]|nr:nuclear transport factor 2 family protein [Microbacteriaceae bacterium]
LYIEDLEGGGREAVQRDISRIMKDFYRTMHQIVGHAIELVDADHATGKVYTRAEHEVGDEWVDMAICYFDSYERRDGVWYFGKRRDLHHLHVSSLSDRPVAPFVPNLPWTANRVPIPAAWGKSWTDYWADSSPEHIAALTHTPVERRAD